ncbi:MAG: hypothetical protein IKP86_12810 [Anaerolineaceae bacterium]|nr:hypothetical protein [Anaerolineaceae bacterium]
MNIALVQSHILWEAKQRNIEKLEGLISANKDADLFLLPEMSFTGFSMNTSRTAEKHMETVTAMKRLACGHKVSLGFGWVRAAGEKCENVYTIIGKDGSTVSEYVKIHPFSRSGEDRYFRGGNRIDVYTIENIPFSTFICYDLRFPELFRQICREIHAVIIPANWPEKRSEHWKTLLRARAIENQIYIFAVNCAGEMNGIYYSGNSCVIAPDGELAMSLSGKEGVLKYNFIDDTERYRKAFPVLDDIRSDFIRDRGQS